MSIDILITTNRISQDPIGREFIAFLQKGEAQLHLTDAALYYDFPTYSDYDTLPHRPDALLLSPKHGIVAVKFIGARASASELESIADSLGQFSSTLIGRLLKSRILRKSLSTLKFSVAPILLCLEGAPVKSIDEEYGELISSLDGFSKYIQSIEENALKTEELAEIRSIVEGAKALTRPQRRQIEDPTKQKFAASLAKLEAEIANFDQQQRRAALVTVTGPQRIRGLAGSGKTVILAMKAAHLHITNPDDTILVTFFTRSLRTALRSLITKFYRNYRDEDPNWKKIHIRHGWGGASSSGVYADASRSVGLAPMNFSVARSAANGGDPFDFACKSLLAKAAIPGTYDQILIDEGQDFPSGFYELCFELAKGSRDQKNIVWAYDELQNILNVNIRTPDQLFGTDADGEPKVSLERSAQFLPPGGTNDTVLSKCYRNQREVLVTAHALGFGIYGQIVQLLESKEHWQDVGYDVVSEGEFSVGEKVRILRPPENSPLSLEQPQQEKLISYKVLTTVEEEVSWVTSEIRKFISGGLQPEDILVVTLDDRNSRTYLRLVSQALAAHGIQSNNIIADPYNEPPFTISGKVTLSTVYRAKGNEASVVLAIGVDAIALKTRLGRNKLFTAFTRTKAWLRVSGINGDAQQIASEIDTAHKHFPYLEFRMPDLRQVDFIQRDLSQRSAKAKKIREAYLKKLRKEGFSDEEIVDILSIEVKDGKS